MDLQKIESFLALAQSLNFTKAAESLYKTQSVLSRHIISMEEELGLQLFTRTKRSVTLTPAGKYLATGFRQVLDLYDTVTAQAAAINTGFDGTLNICTIAGQTVCHTFAPVLREFTKMHSNISVNVVAKDVGTVRSMLQNQQVDFAYGREIDFSGLSGISFTPIIDIAICYVASKSHPASALFHKIKDDSELDRYPFIWTHELGSTIVDRILADRQQRMGNPNVQYAPDLNTMLLWLELGRGFSLLNECSYFAQNPEVRFYPVDRYGKTTEGLICRTDSGNPCVKTLIDFSKEYRSSFHIRHV